MKKLIAISCLCVASIGSIHAQNLAEEVKTTLSTDSLQKLTESTKHEVENLKKLKVSGWVQAQYQIAETKGASGFDGGNFLPDQYQRFMIRRGRVKFTYSQKLSQYVLQVNLSERGVNLVEIFGKVTDPWTKSLSLTAGVMNRPFGFEIQQSSADRETPERSRFTQVLLPNERDLGAMLTYQPVKGSLLYGLKVDGGFFSGNGIAVPGTTSVGGAGLVDTDNFKDFIGRAHYKKSFSGEKYSIGLGISHYNGGIALESDSLYNLYNTNGSFAWTRIDSTTIVKGTKSPRVYSGADFQFSVKSILGITTLRGEYITGTQSGSLKENKSPNVSVVNSTNTVERKFNGGYVYFIQRIAKTKHEFAVKFEWYDPNTKVSSKDVINKTTLTASDLRYDMLGLGYINYWDDNVKFMVYYNFVQNEKGDGLAGYSKDIKDNVLTFRMQYRF